MYVRGVAGNCHPYRDRWNKNDPNFPFLSSLKRDPLLAERRQRVDYEQDLLAATLSKLVVAYQ